VHRDIKPGNILLTENGHAKVSDFGLSKFLDGEAPSSAVTASGKQVGTPEYMAPEQRHGEEDVDHRADIYSLGILLYEMLTGERPVGRWIPPSKAGARTSPKVDRVVEKAVASTPTERIQSVGEIRNQLEQSSKSGSAFSWKRTAVLGAILVVGFVLLAIDERRLGDDPIERHLISGGEAESEEAFKARIEMGLGWIGEDYAFSFDTPLRDFRKLVPASEVDFRPEILRVYPSSVEDKEKEIPVVLSTWHRGEEDWRIAFRSPLPVSTRVDPVMRQDGWTLTDHSPSFGDEHFSIWTRNHPVFASSEPHLRKLDTLQGLRNTREKSYARECLSVGSETVFGLFVKRHEMYGVGPTSYLKRPLVELERIAATRAGSEKWRITLVGWIGGEEASAWAMGRTFFEEAGFETCFTYGGISDLERLYREAVSLAEEGWRIHNVAFSESGESLTMIINWERWEEF
ncbi:MAG: serine/threonine-protein kinase, partial [Verrucomicrobiota bacterium]